MPPSLNHIFTHDEFTVLDPGVHYEIDASAFVSADDLCIGIAIVEYPLDEDNFGSLSMEQISGVMGQTGVAGGYYSAFGMGWSINTSGPSALIESIGCFQITSGLFVSSGSTRIRLKLNSPNGSILGVALVTISEANTLMSFDSSSPFIQNGESELLPEPLPLPFFGGQSTPGIDNGVWLELLTHVAFAHVPTTPPDAHWLFNTDKLLTDSTTWVMLLANGVPTFWVYDNGVGTVSATGAWDVDDISDGSDGIDERTFVGLSVPIIGFYSDEVPIGPPLPDETGELTLTKLHIPFKEWAIQSPVSHLYQMMQNFIRIENWSREIKCTGRSNGRDWENLDLHIPFKETLSGVRMVQNYLAIERWAEQVCNQLHIPFKEWFIQDPSQGWKDLENLKRIEEWASTIGDCCQGGGTPA